MLAFALRADGWYLRQDIIWAKPNPMPESVTDRCTKAHEYLFLLTKSAAVLLRRRRDPRAGDVHGRRVVRQAEPRRDRHDGAEPRAGVAGRTQSPARPQQAVGVAHLNAVVPRGALRDVPGEARAAVHQGRHVGARVLSRVRRAVEAGRRASPTGTERQKCPTEWRSHVGKHGSILVRDERRGIERRAGDGERHDAWLPTCKCAAGDPIPCTVLDPFNGAATTGVAAKLLGRSYIGVDPKAEYLEISRQRLAAEAP
jgi:hypothetical protein